MDPATARIALGDTATWQPSASLQKDPALRDLATIEIFFKVDTPFGDDLTFSTPPGLDFDTPITSSLSTRLGRFDYGIRFQDAEENVLLEIDPEVWVADQWYLGDLPLVLKGYPAAPLPHIILPVEEAVVVPSDRAILTLREEPPHQPSFLGQGLTAVNMQHYGAPIDQVSFAYHFGSDDWMPIGLVDGDLGGWYAPWSVGGLADGPYALRATMTDTLGQVGTTESPVWVDETPPIPVIVAPAAGATVSGTVLVSVVTSATDVISLSIVIYDEWAYWWPPEASTQEAKWGKAHTQGNVRQGEVGKDADDGGNNFCGPTAAGNALEGLAPANNREAQVKRAKDLAKEMGTDPNTGTPNTGEGKTFGSGLKKYIKDNKLDLTVTPYHAGQWDDGTLEFPTWSDLESEFSKGEQIVVLFQEMGADGKPNTADDGPGHYMGVTNVQHGNANPNQHANFRDPDTGADTGDTTVTEDGQNSTPMTMQYDGKTYWVVSFWAISKKDKDNKDQACADTDGGDGWACSWDSENWTTNWYLLEAVMLDADGKWGSAMHMVEVQSACVPVEAPGFDWMPPVPAPGEVVTFTASASGTEPIDYVWDWGDGLSDTGEIALHTYVDPGYYTVTLTAANACGDLAVAKAVAVATPCQPPTDADFDWSPPLPVVGETVHFTASAGGSEPISYTWHLGDGSTKVGRSITHTYDAAGTVDVELVAMNLCGSDAISHAVTIGPGCVPPYDGDFTWTPAAPIAGETITFTGSSSGTAPIDYEWDFGDGTYGSGPIVSHVYLVDGDYNVTLTVTNDCGSELITLLVTVVPGCEPPHDAGFGWDPPIPTAGEEVTFTGSASGSEPLTFTWGFGDGNVGAGITATHAYPAAGDYVVTMFVDNDCGSAMLTGTITVLSETVCVTAIINDVAYDQAGCSFTFTPDVTGDPPITYLWDFGDGVTSTLEIPSHDYATGDTYTVTLEVWNCEGAGYDIYTFTVTCEICEPPYEADFYWLPNPPFVEQPVTFYGSASGSEPLTFTWDFGDGNVGAGQVAIHIYDAPGVYTVTMMVFNGCGEAWVFHPVEVLYACEPPYEADFYWLPNPPFAGQLPGFSWGSGHRFSLRLCASASLR